MRALVLFAISVVGFNVARADTLKSESDIRPFADGVMAKVGTGDLNGAFALMKPFTIIPSAEFDATVLNSKAQRDLAGTRFGTAVGYEFVSESRVGQSLLRLIYIEKTQRHALPWMFYFYRSPEGWVLNSFLWNDQPLSLFGGAR